MSMELERYMKVDFEKNDGIVTITIDRQGETKSDKYNNFNRGFMDNLRELLEEYQYNEDVRAVVITGRGNVFSTGADIEGEFLNMNHNDAYQLASQGQKTIQLLETSPFITLAAINGFALGGGMELTLACDFCIASKNARFGLPEINLGIHPGWGGTQRLPHRIGLQRAKELILSGDPINAQEAFNLGIVREIVEPEDLLPASYRFLKKFSNKSRRSIGIAKTSINKTLHVGLNEGLSCEAELFSIQWGSAAREEGIEAFKNRRKPDFNKTG